MKSFCFLLVVLLLGTIVISGCTQTPSAVEQETPSVLNNATDLFTVPSPTVTTEIVQPTLAPLVTDSGYVAPPVQVATTTQPQDPIIGVWTLEGSSTYSCSASILMDNTGTISCAYGAIQKQITWEPAPSRYSFLNNYTITDQDGNQYDAEYSYNDGTIMSSILPAGTEFVRSN